MREGPALTEARARRASAESRLAIALEQLGAIEMVVRGALMAHGEPTREVLQQILGVLTKPRAGRAGEGER